MLRQIDMTMPNRFSLVGGVADSDNEDAMFRARALKKNICLCLTRNDDNFWNRFNLKNKKPDVSATEVDISSSSTKAQNNYVYR